MPYTAHASRGIVGLAQLRCSNMQCTCSWQQKLCRVLEMLCDCTLMQRVCALNLADALAFAVIWLAVLPAASHTQ
jgi:hypothetical protein